MIRPKLQDSPKYNPESYTCPHCNKKVGNQQHHFCREMWHAPEKEYISKDHQVLGEDLISTDRNGGDVKYHETHGDIFDKSGKQTHSAFFDGMSAAYETIKKMGSFAKNRIFYLYDKTTGKKRKLHEEFFNEATEAPEYYEHIDDIDHERIVKHAEDVIKRIDYILKIYDKHEHKLDNKQFKQVRKHKNQLNKIKTMITSELERHRKQALDEGVMAAHLKLHEETLLPNILKPSRNTDASGYARYISEQNSSSNLRSKPINEGVIDEAKFIKSTEHDYEPFNDKNAYRITDILKSKKFKHESSRGNSHIYVHGNGSKVLLTKSGSGAITGLTHIDSNGKRTLFARKAEGVGQTEIDVKRFQRHLSSLNEGYKYTKVTPEGYEEHKAKILNLLSKYGKAYHHDLGGLAGPDDPEIQRHYEPGFFGRAFGLDKTDPKKHLSAFSTFRLDHPTDPNQHIEVAYTVGGEDLYGWQPSAKTPHLISFSHHIKGHPKGDSDGAVYYSNSPRHTTANSDGFDEIFPQLKSYLKNNFLRNNPIVNVR
jgi:hypothetical protein